MENLKHLLEKIRKEYNVYFREITLEKLIDFISGYSDCIGELTGISAMFDFGNFNFYVISFYGLKINPHTNYIKIIDFFSENKEDAVNKFVELFNAFLALSDKTFYFDNFLKSIEPKRIYESTVNNEKGTSLKVKSFSCEDMTNNINNQLELFRQRPAMYFGRKSLSKMMDYFDGYLYCIKEQSGKEQELIPGFQEYVEKKYNTKKNSNFHHHWAKLISFFAPNLTGVDEDAAFDEFYKLYDAFLKNRHKGS